MLQLLHSAVEHKPQLTYMLLISIFILSQDQFFNKNIQELVRSSFEAI
jgi:hypothetical protein